MEDIVKLLEGEGYSPFVEGGVVMALVDGKWHYFKTIDEVRSFLYG